MDLQVIQNCKYLPIQMLKEGMALEKREVPSEYIYPYIRLYQYNVTTNVRKELAKSLQKLDACPVQYASRSAFIYFAAFSDDVLFLYRVQKETGEEEQLCPLDHDLLTESSVFQKVFVLNDDNIILQKETLQPDLSQSCDISCDFELNLYSVKEKKFYPVVDANLTTNGIESLVAVDDTTCLLKTGYHLLKDQKYLKLDRIQMPVESLCRVKILQLISDIKVGQTNILYEFMEQAFHTSTIPFVACEGGYIIFSCVNFETFEEKITFYNLETDTMLYCINKNVRKMEQLADARLIGGVPVVLLDKDGTVSVYNLLHSDTKFRLNGDKQVFHICDELFAERKPKKKFLFSKPSWEYVFYQYPREQQIYRVSVTAEHELIAMFHCGEHYYIFFD